MRQSVTWWLSTCSTRSNSYTLQVWFWCFGPCLLFSTWLSSVFWCAKQQFGARLVSQLMTSFEICTSKAHNGSFLRLIKIEKAPVPHNQHQSIPKLSGMSITVWIVWDFRCLEKRGIHFIKIFSFSEAGLFFCFVGGAGAALLSCGGASLTAGLVLRAKIARGSRQMVSLRPHVAWFPVVIVYAGWRCTVDQGLSGKYRHRIPPQQQCTGGFFALLACNEWALTTGIDQYICGGTILVHIVPARFSHSTTCSRSSASCRRSGVASSANARVGGCLSTRTRPRNYYILRFFSKIPRVFHREPVVNRQRCVYSLFHDMVNKPRFQLVGIPV